MLRTWKSWAAAAALSLLTAVSALAADVSGKWTWTLMFQDNQIMQTLELKQEGEKLTGTITGRNNQKIEIKEGKVTGNDLSFVVVRERNGQEFKQTYKGKLEGTDTIKGTIAFTGRDGEQRTREWTAKKAQ